MEITPTQAAQTSATTTATKPAEAQSAANAVAGDFQTFLQLLTAQMRNQDPLKPLESTEFVAQLANFSSVEQQVRTNDRLEKIYELLSGGTADGLAAWIGREVRAPVDADFAGSPVEVGVTTAADADRAVLIVRNDFDQVVARQAIEAGLDQVTWSGLSDAGSEAPHGRYSFAVESWKADELIETTPGRIFSEVTEVRFEDGTPVLVVGGGVQVPIEDITALR